MSEGKIVPRRFNDDVSLSMLQCVEGCVRYQMFDAVRFGSNYFYQFDCLQAELNAFEAKYFSNPPKSIDHMLSAFEPLKERASTKLWANVLHWLLKAKEFKVWPCVVSRVNLFVRRAMVNQIFEVRRE